MLLIITFSLFFAPQVSYAIDSPNITSPSPSGQFSVEDARAVLSTYHRNRLNIDRAMEITDDIIEKDPNNIEALIFLSRVWLTYGYVRERTKEGKIKAFETGREIAKRAIEIEPDNPDAHFFYVANLALVGETKGVLNSLFMLPEIRRELDTILELDPNHCYGLGMQGALYLFLPSILGGDNKVSEIYLRRALFVDPHLSSAKLYLAMNLRKQKRYNEAIAVLQDLINDKEPAFYPDWYLNKRFALNLMAKIEEEQK
ncbi:MAG: hypothetical protein AAF462_09225 [Thermodesulfobacteriota bacterium]